MHMPASIRFDLLPPGSGENQGEGFDYTKLTAINTCPTWGITRYGMHKRMPTVYADARSMPLEAGRALHDAFAAVRLAQLWHTHPDHASYHLLRLFGRDRGETLQAVISHSDTIEAGIRAIGVEALATSGFVDSPYDKRRTMSNLEGSITAYTTGYDYQRWPVWVADERIPDGNVGVELPFNIKVTLSSDDKEPVYIRLTGKVDGIHWHKQVGGELQVHENKSSGRLDDTWAQAFEVSHQVTGYCLAGGLISGHTINRAIIRGVQLPLPKMVINGLRDVWIVREPHHYQRWAGWLLHTLDVYHQFKANPVDAPKYSHSCNRYFRPCPMIPFCVGSDAEQQQILSEMVTDEWSPLSEEYDG